MNQTTPSCGILAGEPEIIGERCADGSKCHHFCGENGKTCFRKDIGCAPLDASGLTDTWGNPSAVVKPQDRQKVHKEIRAAAALLLRLATDNGVIVTIEHRRTPDSKPASYIVDTRDARAVYDRKEHK